MADRPQLTLAQTQAAMAAMIQEAAKGPGGPLAFAICDAHGRLAAFARMDDCVLAARDIAIKKAYTAGAMGVESKVFGEQLRGLGVSSGDTGDPNLVGVQGGVPIKRPSDGAIMGGVGTSGRTGDEDEAMARVGVKAMNL